MDDLPRGLYHKGLALFVAYITRHDPGDLEATGTIIAGMQNKSYRIHMNQIIFALAYREFGDGNQ
jgi:hypothetical protein